MKFYSFFKNKFRTSEPYILLVGSFFLLSVYYKYAYDGMPDFPSAFIGFALFYIVKITIEFLRLKKSDNKAN